MLEDKLWKLIAGKITGEATAADVRLLNRYLQRNDTVSRAVNLLSIFWQQTNKPADQLPSPAFEKLMSRIQQGAK